MRQTIWVTLEDVSAQLDPSGSVIVTVLVSARDAGKLVPVMSSVFPPWLLRPVVWLTEVTERLMSFFKTPDATVICPLESVTIGYHEPAVVLGMVHTICVEVDGEETVQTCLANSTVIPVVVSEVPVMVRVLPEREKPEIDAVRAV